jgi:hypothetical protein
MNYEVSVDLQIQQLGLIPASLCLRTVIIPVILWLYYRGLMHTWRVPGITQHQ